MLYGITLNLTAVCLSLIYVITHQCLVHTQCILTLGSDFSEDVHVKKFNAVFFNVYITFLNSTQISSAQFPEINGKENKTCM